MNLIKEDKPPTDPKEWRLYCIRSHMKEYKLQQTEEYKKFERIREQLLVKDNVKAVGRRSDKDGSIIIAVFLEKEDPNFPKEIEGMKIICSIAEEFHT